VTTTFEAISNAGVYYVASGGNAVQLHRHFESIVPVILDALDGWRSAWRSNYFDNVRLERCGGMG